MDDLITGHNQIANGVSQAIYGDERSVFATFYQYAMLDEEKTKQAGRPYHRTVDMIKIEFAGDKTKVIERLVKEEDKIRFPRNWQAYCNKQVQAHEGTPLEQWALLNVAQVADLKAINIHTVEQLASVNDTNLRSGMRTLRENARVWLADAEDGARVLSLQAENENLKMQLQAMMNQKAYLKPSEPEKVEETNVIEIEEAKPIQRLRKKNGTNTTEDGAASNG